VTFSHFFPLSTTLSRLFFFVRLEIAERSVFLDSFEQNRSGFVVRILRDEFAAEGFGEDRLRERLDVRFGFSVPRFNLVGQRANAARIMVRQIRLPG
jgi:hypothetical protein